MTTIDTLRSLQKRIREATGPDRRLSDDILLALGWRTNFPFDPADFNPDDFDQEDFDPYKIWSDGACWYPIGSGNKWIHGHTRPDLLTDPDGLGACVALQRSVFPNSVRDVVAGQSGATVQLLIKRTGIVIRAEHALETHALLLAIVAARIAVIAEEQAREATRA